LVATPAAVDPGRGPARQSAARRPIRIAIQDTGPGIPPEALPRIFERFFQADPSHSRSAGTSGLGLSIVKALVEVQGGRVGAENVPGGGARLWFELPAFSSGGAPVA
jgi:signal transduction histidine kinase